MRRDQFAEWFLSLFVQPEQATSIVGDLTEDARGSGWFWTSVIRTAAAHLVRDFTQRPIALLRVGTTGYLRTLMPGVVLAVFNIVMLAMPGKVEDLISSWVVWLQWPFAVLWLKWPFSCGQWAGRTMPDSEIASGLAVAMIGWLPIFALLAFMRHPTALAPACAAYGVYCVAVIAGAAKERRQRLAHG